MDASLRNTPALMARVEKLSAELIRRFEGIVSLAQIEKNEDRKVEKNDRNTTAIAQYQMQVETAALIRAAEDVQSLIRQMQEAWIFGQLNTIGDSQLQQQTDDEAKEVAALLKQLVDQQNETSAGDTGNGP